jgi:hypothetical protein
MDGGLYPKKQRTKLTNKNAAGINVICSEMIEVFKTNVQKKTQSKMLLCVLSEAFPSFKINFDLSDCDKVLRVEGDNMEALRIMILVKEYGFTCEILD